jgi:hypothetical protein
MAAIQQIYAGLRPVVGGTPTCTEIVPLLSYYTSNYGAISQIGQKIRNDDGMTVCGATFVLRGSGNAVASLWSLQNGTGTQYGTDSQAVAISSENTYDFTWLVNPTVPPATDFFLIVNFPGGDGFQASPDEYEPGLGYSGYAGGALYNNPFDMRFALSVML